MTDERYSYICYPNDPSCKDPDLQFRLRHELRRTGRTMDIAHAACRSLSEYGEVGVVIDLSKGFPTEVTYNVFSDHADNKRPFPSIDNQKELVDIIKAKVFMMTGKYPSVKKLENHYRIHH